MTMSTHMSRILEAQKTQAIIRARFASGLSEQSTGWQVQLRMVKTEVTNCKIQISGLKELPPVVSGHVKLPALAEPPEAEQGLEEVVGDDDALQLKSLPVLHQPLGGAGFLVLVRPYLPTWQVGYKYLPGSQHFDKVDIGHTDRHSRPHRGHQRPCIRSFGGKKVNQPICISRFFFCYAFVLIASYFCLEISPGISELDHHVVVLAQQLCQNLDPKNIQANLVCRLNNSNKMQVLNSLSITNRNSSAETQTHQILLK